MQVRHTKQLSNLQNNIGFRLAINIELHLHLGNVTIAKRVIIHLLHYLDQN